MLEIACFNVLSAIEAAKAGADRIELCFDYAAGGVTPSLDALQLIRKEVKIPINIMIRPRSGDFNYTDAEFGQMKTDIQIFKSEASGFVFGILDDMDQIDVRRNQELVEAAEPLPCTFHRAFDQMRDLHEATEQIVNCGFKSILTSGGQANAVAGAETIAEFHQVFGTKISFIVGGGVRSNNIKALNGTTAQWYHSAAITQPGELVDGEEVRRLQRTLKGGP